MTFSQPHREAFLAPVFPVGGRDHQQAYIAVEHLCLPILHPPLPFRTVEPKGTLHPQLCLRVCLLGGGSSTTTLSLRLSLLVTVLPFSLSFRRAVAEPYLFPNPESPGPAYNRPSGDVCGMNTRSHLQGIVR